MTEKTLLVNPTPEAAVQDQNRTGLLARSLVQDQNRTGLLARSLVQDQNRTGLLARLLVQDQNRRTAGLARALAEEQNRTGLLARSLVQDQNRTGLLARLLVQDQNRRTAGLARALAEEQNRIAWPRKILTDYGERADFYVSRGLKGARPDFPAPAFEKSLDIADLRGDKPLDHKEEGRAPMAYVRIAGLETQLRRCIDERMTACYGPDWPKHQLPNGMYRQWKEKKQKAQQGGRGEDALIAYADFTDYDQVMCKRDNWHVFSPIFDRKENVRESLRRIYPVRVDTMHARQITQDDALLLDLETRRLSKAMNSSGCGGIVCIRH